ncbi:L-2-hydroxyglutarate dehydrogenase, mitochondrial [Phytophthora ramorum]|uniref:L-2-hydroxyglutarate dehydrogenase, mitochondrial n=1 Tax=Phytophthora ramorum TaxID=164328 RepID=UPI0030A28491|nr:L-2-hydroxyglutarate dehydrogenase, mitochondrial [Phytophthora ramorum]
MTPKTLVVAGAGVVGLAVARAAACRGLEVLLLEKNALVGQETSARNSEVVHAGIYYANDSWKATLCVTGREKLYDFCREFGVPFSKCGKLIVAHKHQSEQLGSILKRGLQNGVGDLKLLTQSEARAIEPLVDCHAAVFSPSTGIVDSHGLMLALQGDAETHGAMVARATAIQGGRYDAKSKTFVIRATQSNSKGEEEQEVECDYFVNATGMFAPDLLDKVAAPGVERPSTLPLPTVPDRFAKGTYFKLSPKNRPFSHLVYPIPEVGGLGVHATVDLAGNVRFGPDVEWIDTIEYQPDGSKAEKFAERIRAYWPDACAELLEADYCGIRPKIAVNGTIFEDFYIADKHTHGVPGLVHLCGIESPGLTASLSIADTVVNMLQDKE